MKLVFRKQERLSENKYFLENQNESELLYKNVIVIKPFFIRESIIIIPASREPTSDYSLIFGNTQ